MSNDITKIIKTFLWIAAAVIVVASLVYFFAKL